jgi:death-on-curing protein
MSWEFLTRRTVEAMHLEQLRRPRGATGLRDENPRESTIEELAAAYVFGIARNHAFVDGNKRTAIVAAGTFLLLNGYTLTADDGRLYEFVMGIAAGEINETGAAAFFRDHIEPIEM